MSMDRRLFLRRLLGGAAAVVVAPEVLADIGRAQSVSAPVHVTASVSELNQIWRKVQAPLVASLKSQSQEWEFLEALNIEGREMVTPIHAEAA